jgi:hypothetical protein
MMLRAGPGLRSLAHLSMVVALAAACGSTTGSSPAATVPGSDAAASGATATPTPTPAPTAALAVDATLLDVLPESANGTQITPDPDNAALLISDPTLGRTASGVAVARYATGDDIAVVSVVRLRPGVFSEGFFDTWRADFDASACQPAGGASGVEKVETIGATQVHVGTCTGGANTYHAHLDGDVIVSAVAVGSGSLGQDVMRGLQP